jgi:hypothetical protein
VFAVPMSMDQMQMMMANMHQQNYMNDTKLAQYFQEISSTYSNMAQAEYQMYQMHAGQGQGMTQPMPGQGMRNMGTPGPSTGGMGRY